MQHFDASLKNSFRRIGFGGGVGAILGVSIGLVLLFFSLARNLEDLSLDLPFLFHSDGRIENVVLIYLVRILS